MITRIILLRHGLSVANTGGFLAGQTDVSLEPVGYEQAESAARYIVKNYKIDKIYSSNLSRAYKTALPTAKALSLPIETSAKLRELDVGEWAGKTWEQLSKEYPDIYPYHAYRSDVKCVGGESYDDLVLRSTAEIKRIVSENEGKTVLVTTHGGFIKSLLLGFNYNNVTDIKDLPIVSNASISVIEFDNGAVNFVELNNKRHLESEK